MSDRAGKVYLIGSGPGNAAYLTLRGYQLLTQAEVLIYDALADGELVQLAPTDCLKLDVGKRGGKPSMRQADINRLLIEQVQQGRQVIRLKSGDPFIFGRVTEEIQALLAENCAFEVVPGISSALAAPLLAAIPLTDPVLSRGFAVVSAHEPASLDWAALVRLDTLVLLMGGRQLPQIVAQLCQHGRSRQTPVAVIRWAGRPEQQIWMGTLGDIAERTAGYSLSPCVIVVGEVVSLRQYLSSPHQPPLDFRVQNRDDQTKNLGLGRSVGSASLPLSYQTILVTRSAGQSSAFTTLLQNAGAEVIEMPALEIVPPSNWEALDHAIAHLDSFHWLILSSSNAVDYFFERLLAQGQDGRALAGIKIAVVGEKTAASLHQRGLQPDFIPPDFVADALVEHFPEGNDLTGRRILFPRVETGGRDVLVNALVKKGAEVVEVPAYQSLCPTAIAPAALAALQQGLINIVTFASSKTVKNFCQLLQQANPQYWQAWLTDVCIASIGPQTSKTCRELLGRVDVEAKEFTLEGLTQATIIWVHESTTNSSHSGAS